MADQLLASTAPAKLQQQQQHQTDSAGKAPPPTWDARVVGYKVKTGSDTHAEYELHIHFAGAERVQYRRFREFRSLAQSLGEFMHLFPPNRWLNRLDKEFLQQRLAGLQTYMSVVVAAAHKNDAEAKRMAFILFDWLELNDGITAAIGKPATTSRSKHATPSSSAAAATKSATTTTASGAEAAAKASGEEAPPPRTNVSVSNSDHVEKEEEKETERRTDEAAPCPITSSEGTSATGASENGNGRNDDDDDDDDDDQLPPLTSLADDDDRFRARVSTAPPPVARDDGSSDEVSNKLRAALEQERREADRLYLALHDTTKENARLRAAVEQLSGRLAVIEETQLLMEPSPAATSAHVTEEASPASGTAAAVADSGPGAPDPQQQPHGAVERRVMLQAALKAADRVNAERYAHYKKELSRVERLYRKKLEEERVKYENLLASVTAERDHLQRAMQQSQKKQQPGAGGHAMAAATTTSALRVRSATSAGNQQSVAFATPAVRPRSARAPSANPTSAAEVTIVHELRPPPPIFSGEVLLATKKKTSLEHTEKGR